MSIDLQEERPAYVRFEKRAVEDRAATIANGHYTTRDIEMALITPPYSRDCVEKEVKDWLVELDEHVRNNRMPPRWRDGYRAQYEAWKKGEELPVDGVPIKGWAMLSPSQQANLLQIGVRTVEDLAQMNDEGMKRYGMGALDLKTKAVAWLKTAKSGIAKATQENAALKVKVATLEETVQSQADAIKELTRRLDARDKVAA